MLRAVTVRHLHLELRVPGEDAAATAVHYGQVCAVAYPALTLLYAGMCIKDHTVRIGPDFAGEGGAVLIAVRGAVHKDRPQPTEAEKRAGRKQLWLGGFCCGTALAIASNFQQAGIVAGTIFLLFQWGYVYVQRWMTSYNAIYGSFAALPLLLIWMQTSWEILLFGGELSFAYQNIARFGEERESLLISYDQRRKVLLAVMLTVVRNFRDRGGALPADEIRERLDLPTRIVNDVLFQLVQAGQLIAVRSGDGERETAFTPAHDIASMTVYGVLEAVERSGQTTFDLGQTPELARIDRELETLKESARRSQDNVRLTDLL